MANSAWLLHSLLKSWEPKGNETVAAARRRAMDAMVDRESTPEPPSGPEFWSMHGKAVMLLADIERLIDGMEADGMQVQMFRKSLPKWYQLVFVPSEVWSPKQKSPDEKHFSGPRLSYLRDAMDMLAALGTTLDGFQTTDEFDDLTLKDLESTLREAADATRTIEDIPKDERIYLLGLIEEALRATQDLETFGSSRARLGAMQVGAGLASVSERVSNPGLKKRLRSIYRRLIGMGLSGAQKAVETGASEAVKELMSSE